MKHPHTSSFSLTSTAALLAAALAFTTSACRPRIDAAEAAPQAAAPAPIEPTAARAVLRSQERWAKVTKGDLIAAYDFNVPERKRDEPLGTYLGRMQVHRYEDAKVDEVIGVKDNFAYLRVSTLWTPIIDQAKKVKLDPGQSLTERISMIETWRFAGGDWCYLRPDEEAEFFQAHPEMLHQGGAATPVGEKKLEVQSQMNAPKQADAGAKSTPPH